MKPWEEYQNKQESGPWNEYKVEPSFTEGVKSDLSKRAGEFVTSALDPNKPITTLPFRYASELGGAAGDVALRGLKEITPEPIQKAVKSGVEYVAGLPPVQYAAEKAGEFKQAYPNVTDILAGGATLMGVPVATKAGKEGLGLAGRAAIDLATPNIPEGALHSISLARKYDIPLSLPQVSEGRAVKNIQKIGQELPFSGSEAFRDKQLSRWQKGIFRTIGMDADRFNTKTMDAAFKKVGGEFDGLTAGKSFDIGNDFEKSIVDITENANTLYGKEAADTFAREAMKVYDDFGSNNIISGEKLAFQRARVNKLARKATNDSVRVALLDLENAIIDAITSKDPVLMDKLTKAKQRYKNLIVIEPLAVKAKKGFISPTLLNGRVSAIYGRSHTTGNAGDIGELATIGKDLLGELGGSDTLQKGLYAGTALGGGIAAPTTTVGALGVNRLVQSGIMRNQALINAGAKNTLRRENRRLMKMKPKDAINALRGNR